MSRKISNISDGKDRIEKVIFTFEGFGIL